MSSTIPTPLTQPRHVKALSDQSLPELGGRFSVLARQRSDHEDLEVLLQRLEASSQSEQPYVLLALYRLVFPHAFAEESVLWPVIRRTLPDGEQLTLEVEREHQEVNELVARLDDLGPDSPERQFALARLAEVLREDVRDEEDELFPQLQARLSMGRLRILGVTWEVVRRLAPTRAHPIVSRRPPGNVIAALPLTALDRSRDRLDRWLLRGTRPWAEGPLRSTEGMLERWAHAIEHLAPLRAGENPSTAVRRKPTRGQMMGWCCGLLLVTAVMALGYARLRRDRRLFAGRGARSPRLASSESATTP
jgi:hypothetical protein